MKSRSAKAAITAVFAALLISGCVSADFVKPGDGYKAKVSGHSYDEVWSAAIRALSGYLHIVDTDKPAGSIRAQTGPSLKAWGEAIGIFITPTTPSSPYYTIEVVTERRMQAQITAQEGNPGWEIMNRIRRELRSIN